MHAAPMRETGEGRVEALQRHSITWVACWVLSANQPAAPLSVLNQSWASPAAPCRPFRQQRLLCVPRVRVSRRTTNRER